MAAVKDSITGLYITFFNRAPDLTGLNYWLNEATKTGADPVKVLFDISSSFAKNPVALVNYPASMSNDAVVTQMYQFALGREPDAAGKAFWVDLLTKGTSRSDLMVQFLNATLDYDATKDTTSDAATKTIALDAQALVKNKIATAIAFAESAASTVTAVPLDAQGNPDVNSPEYKASQDVLKGITKDPATVDTAKTTTIPAAHQSLANYTLTSDITTVDEGKAVTFTLTTDVAPSADKVISISLNGDTKGGTITATDAFDFAAKTFDVTLPATKTSVTFTTTPLANDGTEGFEGFKALAFDSNVNLLAQTASTIVIKDATVDVTAPVITDKQTFSYAENQAKDATVGTVAATDDIAVTGFTIASGNDKGYFAIDATGKITLTEAGTTNPVASNDFETKGSPFTLGITAKDAAGNTSTATNVTVNVTNVDDDAPTFKAASASGTKVVVEFNEALLTTSIPAGSAFTVTETLNGLVTSKTLSATDPVAINNASIILNLASAIQVGSTVKVTYTPPATNPIKDLVGNTAAAVTDKTVTLDTTAPTLASSTPADNATSVAITDNVVLTFSESVVAGTGNIVITNEADATDTRTISVSDTAQVSFNGSAVTINPTADLKTAANYNVTLASGVIKDSIGNVFAGITSSTTLNFSTPGGSGSGGAGSTFTLTSFDDTGASFTGGTGDDTYNGIAGTLNSGDVLNGAGGNDTVNALGVNGVLTSTLTSIETLSLRSDGTAGRGLNLSNSTGYTTLVNDRSTDDFTFSNISSTTPVLKVKNAEETTFSFLPSAVTGSSDTAKLTIQGLNTGAAGITIPSIEILNITGEMDSTVLPSTTMITAAAATTANFLGSVAVRAGLLNNTAGTATTVSGSSMTAGGFDVQLANTGTVNVTGSSFDDTLRIKDAWVSSLYTVNLGSGTDVLLFAADPAGPLQTAYKNITGYEALGFTAGANTLDLAGVAVPTAFAGISDIRIDLASGTSAATDDIALSNVNGGTVFTFTADRGSVATNATDFDNFVITSFAGAGSKDITLKLNGTSATATDTSFILDDVVAPAGVIGTINIESNGSGLTTLNTITTMAAANATKLAIKGSVPLTLTNLLDTETVNVDATNLSGALTVTTSASATEVLGGSGNDAITGAAGNDVLKGNAGNDTLTGLGGTDTINGGDGNDTISGGLLVDTLTGGTGSDIFKMTTAIANGIDVITDFTKGTGGDNFTVSIAATGFSNLITGAPGTAIAAGNVPTIKSATAATTLAAGDNIVALVGSTFADTAAVKTAIEAGGSRALTFAAATAAGDDFLVLWSNGTNAFLSNVDLTAGAAAAVAAGDATVTNIVQLSGITSLAAGDFVSGNFAFIA